MKVVTTNGTLVQDEYGKGKPDARPLTEDEAKAQAAECNKRAEALGLKVRYEVRP